MSDSETQTVPASVERFVKQLVITLKAVTLYPAASSIPKENAVETVRALNTILQDRPEVRFVVQKEGLVYGGLVIHEGQSAFESFARELYNRGLAEIRFHSGVEPDNLTAFLGVLKSSPQELTDAGGFEHRLWELGVDSITVKEAAARIVDSDAGQLGVSEFETWPPEAEFIDELVEGALDGRPRDKRLLVRVISDAEALGSYLRETLVGRGVDPMAALRDLKLSELARAIGQNDQETRTAAYRALADAIGQLDPSIRRALVTERLLPDARTDGELAGVVRHLDIDDVCHWLVEGVSADELSVDGLARAIRNLALISLAERETVVNAAGAAMRGAGMPETTVADVLETVAPSTLRVTDAGRVPEEEQPVDSILQLVNLAPGTVATRFEDDPGFLAIQDESRLGISDGDVVAALVTLVTVDSHGASFSAMMALLEDTLELTIERGDYDVAADAAEALLRTAEDPELTANRRERVRLALARLCAVRELAVVVKAMRMYRPETPEHQACERLLGALGEATIGPLLEILADEPDMTARKALVDTIASLAGGYVTELGERVTDSRWYFVRNVVAILGSTKNPEILSYLNRTLRHPDARVRRETIRALSSVQDRLAIEMLIAALGDEDAQNVGLAARYLGASRVVSAVNALSQVALGEGRGNRDTGPRVEAIEALGRLGSLEALPALEDIAGKRTIVRGARTRELRSAADHAIAAIRGSGGASDE